MAYITKFDGSVNKTVSIGGKGNPQSVEGYYLGAKDTKGKFGPCKLHIFQTEDGHIGVWGKSRMNYLLTQDLKGQMVLVTFKGMIPSNKGNPAFDYSVQHDPANTIDTTGVDANAQPPQEPELDTVDEEIDFDAVDAEEDVVELPRPKAPVRAATVDPAKQARLQQMLASRRK